MNFLCPNSRALLPIFRTNCPDGSHFAQMESHFAQNTTTNPCSLPSRHKSFSGICTYTKHPQPHPKTPLFLQVRNLKVGKMNYHLGKMDPNRAKCLKSGQNFSRSGPKKIIHARQGALLKVPGHQEGPKKPSQWKFIS